jgi:CDP-diacylglycerol--glycerol-3-phosphate 3-phosphatidyltransferase
VLVIIINIYIIKYHGEIIVPILIAALIFISDFVDGRLARYFSSVSHLGAILDVTADFLYIAVSYIVVHSLNIVPLWFLFVIMFKFIEFIVTSFFLRKYSNRESVFVFDFIGRAVSIIFYVIPISAYVLFCLFHGKYYFAYDIFIFIVTAMSLISSIYRINNCVYAYRNKFKALYMEE